MKKRFKGMYFKHQKGGYTVSLIVGISVDHAFIQIITNNDSYYFPYPLSAYQGGRTITVGKNLFSPHGVKVHIEENGFIISGEIKYSRLTPLRYDIMGPFKFLPMQCRHKVFSLHHHLAGSLIIDGKKMDFDGGTGYIEGDFGTSFPSSYTWIQSNDFSQKACVMVSVADIPWAWSHFCGCICIVYFQGKEYRLATYLGAKTLFCDEKRISLQQGRLRLEIEIESGAAHKLIAPQKGEMQREIRECITCGARFYLWKDGKVLFRQSSKKASFEYVQ